MRGLEEYIRVHGEHLTERLVKDTTYIKWDSPRIGMSLEGQVYYNVTKATLGDILFLANVFYKKGSTASLRKRLKLVYAVIGKWDMKGTAFTIFQLQNKDRDIDLKDYI